MAYTPIPLPIFDPYDDQYKKTHDAFGNPIVDPYASTGIPENNPYKTIENSQARIASTGAEPEKQDSGVGNVLMSLLKVLSIPQQLVTTALEGITDDTGKFNIGRKLGEVFTLQSESSIKDTFENLGWKNDSKHKWYEPENLLRNVLGFAGDVALDPLTYVGGVGVAGKVAKGVEASSVLRDGLKEAVSHTFTKSSDEIASELAHYMGKSKADVLAQIGKTSADKEVADLNMRAAYSIMGNPEYFKTGGRIATDAQGVDWAKYILEHGVDGLNADILSKFSKPLQEAKAGIKTGDMKDIQSRLTGILSGNATFNSAFTEDTLGKLNTLSQKFANEPTRGLAMSFIDDLKSYVKNPTEMLGGRTTKYTKAERAEILDQLYPGMKVDPRRVAGSMTDRELSMVESYVSTFGKYDDTTKELLNGTDIENSIRKLSGSKVSDKTLGKLDALLGEHTTLQGQVKLLDNGVEFASGIQRLYDAYGKRIFLNYHNLFTGTTKPLLDISAMIPNEKIAAATGKLMDGILNPLSPVFGAMGGVGRAIGDVFSTEHISLAKGDPGYEAGKWFARNVTKFQRAETGIPKTALQNFVGMMYKKVPEFLKDEHIQRASIYFIERNNDDFAKATWAYISHGTIDAAESPEAADILKQMLSPTAGVEHEAGIARAAEALRDLRESGKFKDPEMLKKLNHVAVQNSMFNEALGNYDVVNGISFRKMAEEQGMDATEILTPDTYVHRVRELDAERAKAAHITSKPDELLKKSLSKTQHEADKRVYSSYAAELSTSKDTALKLHDNLLMAGAMRNLSTLTVKLNRDFHESIMKAMTEIKGMDSLISTNEAEALRKGFKRLELGQTTDDLPAIYGHHAVVNQLGRIAKLTSTNKGVLDALGFYDDITNILKSLQTSFNPAFVLRNGIGEPMMNWFAGVSIKSHTMAHDIMKQLMDDDMIRVGDTTFHKGNPLYRTIEKEHTFTPVGKTGKAGKETTRKVTATQYVHDTTATAKERLSDTWSSKHKSSGFNWDSNPSVVESMTNTEDMVRKEAIASRGIKTYKVGHRDLTAHEIMQEFLNGGLGWSGVSKGNLIRNAAKMVRQEVKGAFGGASPLNIPAKMMNASDYMETWTRLAHYVDRLDKGKSIQEALQDVRLYHVDYRDLTRVESQFFRRLMPYYTYMRKNLPIQMRTILTHTNKVALIGHLMDSAYENVTQDNNGETPATDPYLQTGMALPISVDNDGNVQYLNWNLPLSDVSRLRYDFKDLFSVNVLDMLSPLIKAPVEISTNQNMRFGNEIEKYPGQIKPILPAWKNSPAWLPAWADYVLQQAGVAQSIRTAVGQAMQAADGGTNDPLKPENPLAYVGLNSLLPVKNNQAMKNNQAYEYRDQLQGQIKKLKDQGVDVPDKAPDLTKAYKTSYPKFTP